MSFPDLIQALTLKRLESVWMHNMGENLAVIRRGRNISELPKHKNSPAIVVGAGPSVKHENVMLLKDWSGLTFTCDRMLLPLLQKGIVPNYVVSVDGNEKIAEFYNHELVAKHGDKLKIILNCQTTHPKVMEALSKISDSVYWFVGVWDNPFADISLTRIFHHLTNGKVMMSTGGNTGSACWSLATYLECSPIGLLGIDFAYEEEKIEETTYFETFKIISGGNLEKLLANYRQATTWAGKKVLTDLMFLTYYSTLLPQVESATVKTFNLGKYSILPIDKVSPMPFSTFIETFKAKTN